MVYENVSSNYIQWGNIQYGKVYRQSVGTWWWHRYRYHHPNRVSGTQDNRWYETVWIQPAPSGTGWTDPERRHHCCRQKFWLRFFQGGHGRLSNSSVSLQNHLQFSSETPSTTDFCWSGSRIFTMISKGDTVTAAMNEHVDYNGKQYPIALPENLMSIIQAGGLNKSHAQTEWTGLRRKADGRNSYRKIYQKQCGSLVNLATLTLRAWPDRSHDPPWYFYSIVQRNLKRWDSRNYRIRIKLFWFIVILFRQASLMIQDISMRRCFCEKYGIMKRMYCSDGIYRS